MVGHKTESPRILFVIKTMTTGGAERHLAQILPALRQRGLGVELFVLERGGQLEPALAAEGVTISGPTRNLPAQLHVFVAALYLFFRVLMSRPDILHFYLPEPYLVGATVALLTGHRNCFMSRRSLAVYQLKYPLFGKLERVFHRQMKALIGNSRAVADELVAESGESRKVGLIYNGVRIGAQRKDRAAARRDLGIPQDAFTMAIVANLISYKGHADLLDALALVSAKLPQPWRLLVIGRDDGIGAQLRAQARQRDIDANMMWLGERTDVESILPAADVGLLVSHQEGFSNALIEIMAQGLPAIATAVGGNLDAIVDGETGILVPVQNPQRLGEAILDLALNAEKRAAMGKLGRARAIREFSFDGCADRYERLYRSYRELPQRPVQQLIDTPLLSGVH